MQADPYSLNNLQDILVPEPPPIWPPAPGMWLALGVFLLAMLLAGWLIYTKQQQNAYRKAGLSLLGEVKTAYDVSIVMKRVALAAFPREQVASLYGDDWAAFLHNTCPRENFQPLTTTGESPELDRRLVELASIWIRHHRVPEQRAGTAVH